MNVAGIDVSSLAIDVVWVDLDDLEPPHWSRWELAGKDAWERCRYIGQVFPGPTNTMWEDTTAIGVEVAFGPSSGSVNRCVGAVLSRLPYDVLVEPWPPAKWRKAVGLAGHASKAAVWEHAWDSTDLREWMITADGYVPYDTADAYCIALATRQAITRKQAA